MPRGMVCLLNRGLVDKLQPGNRVTIIGAPVNHAKGPDKDVNMNFFMGFGFAKGGNEEGRIGPSLSSKDEEEIKLLTKDPQLKQ